MKRKVRQYFVARALRELLPRIRQVHEEREGRNRHIGLHGKMAGSSQSQDKILPVAEGTK